MAGKSQLWLKLITDNKHRISGWATRPPGALRRKSAHTLFDTSNTYAFCGRDESSQTRLQRAMVLRPGDVGSLWWLHVNSMWRRNIHFSKAQLGHVPGSVSENWVWRALMSSSNPLIDSEYDRQLRVSGDRGGWGLAKEVWCGRVYPAPAPSCFFSAMFTLHCEVLSHQERRTNRADWTEVSENSKLEWTLLPLGLIPCGIGHVLNPSAWAAKPGWEGELFTKNPRY